MSVKIINFGIVGCGAIADFHAQAIESLENDDLRDYLKDILKTFTKEEKSIKKLLEG